MVEAARATVDGGCSATRFRPSRNCITEADPSDLTARDGCTIYLERRDDGKFEGSTLERLCTSNLRGSTWASSEVVVGEDALVSWDRGWDDSGAQIWGAEKAGYRFDRVPASD